MIALDGRSCEPGSCAPFAPRKPAALKAWKTFLTDLTERYGPERRFLATEPGDSKDADPRVADLERAELPELLQAQAQRRRVRQAPSQRSRCDHQGRPARGDRSRRHVRDAARRPQAGISAWDYLGRLYDVKGAKKHFDGVAPHPYAAKLDKVLVQIDLLRDEMIAAGDRRTDLWITEIGWASGGAPNPLNRGLQGQADRLREMFSYFKRKRNKLGIRNVDWYSWRDNVNPDGGAVRVVSEVRPVRRESEREAGLGRIHAVHRRLLSRCRPRRQEGRAIASSRACWPCSQPPS